MHGPRESTHNCIKPIGSGEATFSFDGLAQLIRWGNPSAVENSLKQSEQEQTSNKQLND